MNTAVNTLKERRCTDISFPRRPRRIQILQQIPRLPAIKFIVAAPPKKTKIEAMGTDSFSDANVKTTRSLKDLSNEQK